MLVRFISLKIQAFLVVLRAALWLGAYHCSAETIIWTNLSGGEWGTKENWNPNQVPDAASHDAVITNDGKYIVVLDRSLQLANFTLGGVSGVQTLVNNNFYSLTLQGTGNVRTNGVLRWRGNLLGSGTLAVSGQFIWSGGASDPAAAICIETNGLLQVEATSFLYGALTNEGRVQWMNDAALDGRCCGFVVNQPNGVLELWNDQPAHGIFVNAGTIRKLAGMGVTQFGGTLTNTGTVDVRSGTISFGGGSATVFENGTRLVGTGTNQLGAGIITLNGEIYSENMVLAASTSFGVPALKGTNKIFGRWAWLNGYLGHDGPADVTLATNSVLILAGDGTHFLYGVLTNAGTVLWTNNGYLRLGNARFENSFDGLVEILNEPTLDGNGTAHNAGRIRKSGSVGTARVGVPFVNSGTVEVRDGSLDFDSALTNQPSGTLQGCGSLRLPSLSFINQGRISPGSGLGTLNVLGSLPQTVTAALDIELGGTNQGSYDRLAVTGAVEFPGTLNVRLANDFVPKLGDQFQIMTFASFSGDFACLNGLNLLGAARRLALVYGSNDLTLVVTNAAVGPQAPALRLTQDKDRLLLCWPTEYAGYRLLSATNITTALANWVESPLKASNQVVINPIEPERYFLLRKKE